QEHHREPRDTGPRTEGRRGRGRAIHRRPDQEPARNHTAAAFTTPTGGPLNPRSDYTEWKRLFELAGVPERTSAMFQQVNLPERPPALVRDRGRMPPRLPPGMRPQVRRRSPVGRSRGTTS